MILFIEAAERRRRQSVQLFKATWNTWRDKSSRNRGRAWFGIKLERGATLPEMLIAIVLSTFAAGLIATAAYQFFIVTNDSNNRLAVLHDLENASTWLGRDASESQLFSPGSGAIYGTLETGNPSIKYRYSYDTGNTALVREDLVDEVVQSTIRIARWIANQGDVVFSVSGNLLTVSITATDADGLLSESATLKFSMKVH